MDHHSPSNILAERLGRFAAFVAIPGVLALIVLVTQRLSRDSLALLIGLSCGIGTMLPTLGLGFFILRRETSRRLPTERQTTSTPAIPPVIVVTPSMLPNPNDAQRRPTIEVEPLGQSAYGQRTFTIVGGEE